jgi:hypothetical protein
VQQMVRNWVPMGDAGMDLMKALMGGLTGGSESKKK